MQANAPHFKGSQYSVALISFAILAATILAGCSSTTQSYLERVEASEAPNEIPGGVAIEVAPAVGQVIPVKVTVPDQSGALATWALYREDCYAVTEDGSKVTTIEPEDAIAAAGVEPLAKAIIKESEAATARVVALSTSKTLTQDIPSGGYRMPRGEWTTGGKTIIDIGGAQPAANAALLGAIVIGQMIYYNLNPSELHAAQIESWSLARRVPPKPTLCSNRCYVYFPAGKYKTFKIAVKKGWFSDPVLMSTPWPSPAPAEIKGAPKVAETPPPPPAGTAAAPSPVH